MGDDHERELARVAQVVQEVNDLILALAVQVAGRLVSQQEGWVVGERASDRDPLALADGKLSGTMCATVGEADFLDQALGSFGSLGGSVGALEHRDLDVFERGQGGHQVKGLEDESDLAGAVGVDVELGERVPAEKDIALGGAVEAAQNVEKRAFPATTGPGDRHRFGLGDFERHATKGLNMAVGKVLGKPLGAEQWPNCSSLVALIHSGGPRWVRARRP